MGSTSGRLPKTEAWPGSVVEDLAVQTVLPPAARGASGSPAQWPAWAGKGSRGRVSQNRSTIEGHDEASTGGASTRARRPARRASSPREEKPLQNQSGPGGRLSAQDVGQRNPPIRKQRPVPERRRLRQEGGPSNAASAPPGPTRYALQHPPTRAARMVSCEDVAASATLTVTNGGRPSPRGALVSV